MLEFQLAMLADDTLTEPAYAAIAGGAAADIAWSRALDAESPATKAPTTSISAPARRT